MCGQKMKNFEIARTVQLRELFATVLCLASFNITAAPPETESHQLAIQTANTFAHPQAIPVAKSQHSTRRERIRSLPPASTIRPVRSGEDHVYANPDATISLVTYMDFNCGYCRQFLPVLQRAVNESRGDVNWVFRHFPLTDSVDAPLTQALAAECVAELRGETRFWQFTKTLLTQSRRMTNDPEILIERAALKQGLDWPRLQACIARGDHRKKILDDRAEALKVGVVATPSTLVVRGGSLLLLEGTVTTDELSAELQKMVD